MEEIQRDLCDFQQGRSGANIIFLGNTSDSLVVPAAENHLKRRTFDGKQCLFKLKRANFLLKELWPPPLSSYFFCSVEHPAERCLFLVTPTAGEVL